MAISMKTTSGKLLASAALLATAAGIAGMGTYGAFTSTTQADLSVGSGDVVIALDKPGSPTDLTVAASGILPGDTVERLVTLTNDESPLSTVTLSTSPVLAQGATESVLTSDATNGLQLVIESCPTAWSGSPAAGYTCAAATTLVSSSPIIAASRSLTGLGVLASGGIDHLKVTAAFPGGAPQATFKNAQATVNFSFTAQQRGGTKK